MRLVIFLTFLFCSLTGYSCTAIVVSSKASADGRPYIFKNCDTEKHDVCVRVFGGGNRYRFLALVNSNYFLPDRVIAGFNEKGFSIINTNTHNQNGNRKDNVENTRLMRKALEKCASISDFQHMLDTIRRPMHLNTCFGVMDATGSVAIIEAGNKKYVIYDANSTKNGWIVRGNYAHSGDTIKLYGYEREKALEAFVIGHMKNKKLKFEDIVFEASRFDCIPRKQTSSAILIHGIKKRESPLSTVAWTACGSPLTTPFIPLWLTANNDLPNVVTSKVKGTASSLALKSLKTRRKLHSVTSREKVEEVRNLEQNIVNASLKAVRGKRKKNNKESDRVVLRFYQWVDKYIRKEWL